MKQEKPSISAMLNSKKIKEHITENMRLDNRNLLDYREIKITPSLLPKANGSALVEIGDTKVLAGVKFEMGSPFPDTPNEGVLMVSGEILPISSVTKEPGPPTEQEIELSRVVDRGIRESKMVELGKLVVVPGEKVLKMFVDFSVIHDSGNLLDATALAAVTALYVTKGPSIKELRDDESADIYTVKQIALKVKDIPITVTVSNICGKLLVDATSEEESAINSKLTVTHKDNDDICSMQKAGKEGIPYDDVFNILDIAKDLRKDLRSKIKIALK